MADDDDPTGTSPEPEDAPTKSPEVNPEASKAATLTDEELQKKMRREKVEGERAALKRLSEELGMSIEDAKKVIQSDKERRDAEKTELERLQEQLDAVRRDREAETSRLQQEHHIDRVKFRLARAGLALPGDKDDAEDALNRVVGLVVAPQGAAVEDIDSDIERVRTQFPQLFQRTEEPKPTGNVPSNPSGTPRKAVLNVDDAMDIGSRIAQQYNARHGVVPNNA